MDTKSLAWCQVVVGSSDHFPDHERPRLLIVERCLVPARDVDHLDNTIIRLSQTVVESPDRRVELPIDPGWQVDGNVVAVGDRR